MRTAKVLEERLEATLQNQVDCFQRPLAQRSYHSLNVLRATVASEFSTEAFQTIAILNSPHQPFKPSLGVLSPQIIHDSTQVGSLTHAAERVHILLLEAHFVIEQPQRHLGPLVPGVAACCGIPRCQREEQLWFLALRIRVVLCILNQLQDEVPAEGDGAQLLHLCITKKIPSLCQAEEMDM